MSTTLTLTLGRDEEFELHVTDAAGAAYALDDCTLALAVSLTPGGPALLRLEVGSGLEIRDAAAGVVRAFFSAPAKAAAGLSDLAGAYWDLLVVDAAGHAFPNDALSGPVVIEPSVTQRTP